MQSLVEWGLANAATAALMALGVAVITRVWRNPHLAHLLWLIVLLRLVAPPVIQVPLPTLEWRGAREARETAVTSVDVPSVSIAESSTVHRGERSESTASAPTLTPSTSHPESSLPLAARTQTTGPTKGIALPARPTSDMFALSTATSIAVWEALAGIWISGSVLYAALTVARVQRFGVAVRRSSAIGPGWLEGEISDVAHAIGLRRIPNVRVVEWTLPPMIWSGVRPTLLIPQALVESMNPAQRRLLLLHELLHLRRRDHLIRWFAVVVLALYWWNPFAWWAVRRLQDAEEECCDADVLAFHPQQAELYGEALFVVCEFVSCGSLPAPAISVGVERKNHLKRRMTMILKGSKWSKLSRAYLTAVIGCGAVVLGISLTTAAAQVNPTPEINATTKDEPKQAEPKSQKLITAVSGQTTVPAKPFAAPQPSRPVASTPALPSTPKPPAFLRYTALELRPTDDETQNILKQRYNAAVRSVQLYEYQYDINKTPLGNVLAAARNLLEAKQSLAKKSEDQSRALEDYLEFVTYSWRLAKDRLDIGGATGFSAVDEAQAREAMFDAKLKVAQLVSREKAKPPGTTQPLMPAAGFSRRHAEAFVQSLKVRVRIADAEVVAARAVAQQAEVELRRASANLKYREAQLVRVQAAKKANGVSQSDVDEATHLRDDAISSVDAARAVLAAAEAQGVIKVAQSEQVALELKQAQEAGK